MNWQACGAFVIAMVIGYVVSVGARQAIQPTVNHDQTAVASDVPPLRADLMGILMTGRKPNGDAGVIQLDMAGRVICAPDVR